MTQDDARTTDAGATQGETQARNPYILNFCRVLVEKRGEQHDPEELENVLEKMYTLYEYMLGTHMVNSLPEDARSRYLTLAEDLGSLSYEKISEVFGAHVPNYAQIMKDTMKQFAELYMRNGSLDPKDYPTGR
jgi:hypothetical protein